MAHTSPQFLPAYLAVGEDEPKRMAATKRIKSHVSKEFEAFNLAEFRASAISNPTELSDALVQIPFSDPFRVVIIYDADKLSKETTDVVLDYLAKPSATTILLLEATKLAKNSRVYKAILALGKGAIIDCSLPKGYALADYIVEIAQKQFDITLNKNAAYELIACYGQDMSLISNALKGAKSQGKTQISVQDVKQNFVATEAPKPWSFADALANKNAAEALSLFSKRKPGEETLLFWYATAKLRELLCAYSVQQEGRAGEIAQVLGGPAWKYKNLATQARAFTKKKLVALFNEAMQVEEAIKGSANSEQTFIRWILQFCKK